MEKVHFQMEQMLPALRLLHKIQIFTAAEIKSIYKTRLSYERKLIARVSKKEDWLRYIEYEGRLEKLRSVRWKRVGPEKNKEAEHSLTRRQLYLYERATTKFKADIALWVAYIQFATSINSPARASRVCAKAIQLFPNTPSLYILGSQLHSGEEGVYASPDASRTMLQRGLRMNGESIELWTEYVRFEMGFVEMLRRRWAVLGVRPESEMEGVMNGEVVKTVLDEGAKANPTPAYFKAMLGAIRAYPSTETMKESLTTHTYELLQQTLPKDGDARMLHALRHLDGVDEGWEDEVDLIRDANQEMMSAEEEGVPEMARLRQEWLKSMCESTQLDENLRYWMIAQIESR